MMREAQATFWMHLTWKMLKMNVFLHSMSLLGGNLVDGLQRALHEASGVPHGRLGPAPIHDLDF